MRHEMASSVTAVIGRPHTDEIAVLEVEAVQLVAGLLRVHDILEDDKSSALGVVRNALSHLAVGTRRHR